MRTKTLIEFLLIFFQPPELQTYPNVRRVGLIFATGASTVKITIGASWETGSLCGAGSWICKNSPLYSDILCFVHILIEHYWKYNNKNNPDIKLSYKAKPIFALSCNKARVLYQTLLAGLVCLTNHWFHNSMKLQMKYNSFMRHTVHSTFWYLIRRNEK